MCHGYKLVKSLFAVYPGVPYGLDGPHSSLGAASFTLQAFSSSVLVSYSFDSFYAYECLV